MLISIVAPAMLTYILLDGLLTDLDKPYGGYPQWMLVTFGWGAAVAVIVFGFLARAVRWRPELDCLKHSVRLMHRTKAVLEP